MAPIAYRHPDRSSTEPTPETGFECSRCSGRLRRESWSLTCSGCGFVPAHGAD